ncbi:MAG: hypothetical protein KME49_27750 [Brasilonema octagenarum HA4186-MV1]|jgi:hypothetical protein|uniref:Uncharacterized protein n=2 Tax=Brasilonema TaxID=383614 RepID=A0A856MQH0_9CYAN|nr:MULTISPECIES: hypothetical protein [Brasilonema]MBW4629201.1 hypothetical protein [Brasilonema octagenarum HA4186-MV1]NMF65271.1 hypothetical protein [Brasilonema octagenarum UFV-OR1]QDL11667.1 hypothetical protein DP114_30605 [Brasilonema sennae CENA114]QDL18046.1 hypothetical protein DP113_30740 [Brasilonema octagenarum UFV-E1]
METKETIEFAGLPLAVYREIAAHLCQVEGVEVSLIPQTSQQFDYSQSQIAGLWISYTPECGAQSRQRVQQILTYYRDRYVA